VRRLEKDWILVNYILHRHTLVRARQVIRLNLSPMVDAVRPSRESATTRSIPRRVFCVRGVENHSGRGRRPTLSLSQVEVRECVL